MQESESMHGYDITCPCRC